MTYKFSVLFTTLFLFTLSLSKAQVTADFTVNKSSGCSPLAGVQFTDKSMPSDNVTWAWDLGNGNLSSVQNPIATYNAGGTYTVKLTATRNGVSNTKTMQIRVFNNPVANFSTIDNKTKGCVPLTVRFNDLSVEGDTTLKSWLWQYGTGAYDTLRQKDFVYNYAGKNTVSLTVTDNHGCWNTVTKTDYVDAANPPQASFIPDPLDACSVPITVTFHNTSIVKGTASYQWIAGSQASSQKDAVFTFSKFETIPVQLTVTDLDYNCISEPNLTSYPITQVKAIGTLKQGTKTLNYTNDIVCAGTVNMQSLSIPLNGTIGWLIDSDIISTYKENVDTVFNQAGNHTIRLVSSPGTACADTLKWSFYVEKVVPEFSFNPPATCQSSASVLFTNTSSVNAASILWKFSNGNTSNSKTTVTQSFSAQPDASVYDIHDAQLFDNKLIASTINGCKDSVTHSFVIKRPTAMFRVDTLSGCTNLKVTFTDVSLSDSAIVSRDWDFGDGFTSHKTTETVEQHVYATAGIFNAKLTITTIGGCSDASYTIPIKIGTPPHADFTVSPPTACQPDLVTITDATPASDKPDYWYYTINGISIGACASENSPTFKFKPDVGLMTLKQVVGYNGCYAESTRTFTNNGPVASFTYDIPNCANPYSYQFNGAYKGTAGATFSWDFGDGTPIENSQNPSHTFPNSPDENKDYDVKLTVTLGGCSDVVTQKVRVRKSIASFTAPAWACAMQPVTFSASASQPMSELCGENYQWNFDDTTSLILTNSDPVKHTFKYSGNYKVKFSAIHDNGCTDTVSHRIRIYRPKARLTTDKVGGCPGVQIKFTDNSLPDPDKASNPITKLFVNFDNMNDTSSLLVPESSFNHVYINEGLFLPYLKVTDSKGCYDSTSVSVGIIQPVVNIILPPSPTPDGLANQICVGTSLNIVQSFQEADSMLWNFGDGTTSKSNVQSIDHVYSNEGTFNLNVKVYKFGCSGVNQIPIETQKADASFTVSDSVLLCPTKPISFKHLYPSHSIITGEWDTGDKKFAYDTTNNTILYNYKDPGTYITQLTVTTSFGCTDFKTKKVRILSPGAKFDITPVSRQACKQEQVTFTMRDTINIGKYEWDFGDGTSDKTSSHPTAQHKYISGGKKYVFLSINNPSGVCPKTIADSITIDEVIAKFSVQDTAGCDKTPMVFTNLSTGNTTQTWNFSDGPVSTEVSPEHTFVPGTYPVSLVVYSPNLCRDTARRTVTVTSTPSITVSITSCANKKAQLHATGGNYIRWWPKQGLSDSTSYDPVATPNGSVYYKARVTNINGGCTKTDSVLIIRPLAKISPRDTSIAIGDSVQIIVTDTSSIKNYRWEPSTFLSCTDCLNPTARPEESTTYFLVLAEPSGCFTDSLRVSIVLDYTNIGVNFPDAFKPGSNDENNMFKMRGKAILEVLEFKIYNRWGNLVFSTTDKNAGWDGKYQGKDQPIDTYIYVVTVRMGDQNVKGGVTVKKKGRFLLLR